jgi:hypothetical protein
MPIQEEKEDDTQSVNVGNLYRCPARFSWYLDFVQ